MADEKLPGADKNVAEPAVAATSVIRAVRVKRAVRAERFEVPIERDTKNCVFCIRS